MHDYKKGVTDAVGRAYARKGKAGPKQLELRMPKRKPRGFWKLYAQRLERTLMAERMNAAKKAVE